MRVTVLFSIYILITTTAVYGAPPDVTTTRSEPDAEKKTEDKLDINAVDEGVMQMDQKAAEVNGAADTAEEAAKKEEDKLPGVNPDEMLHDSGVDEHEKPVDSKTVNPRFNLKAGAQDPEELMHGSDKVHDDHGGEGKDAEEDDGDESVPSSVTDPDSMMHGAGHSHDQKADIRAAEEDKAPSSVMDPDSMMHGDGNSHDHKAKAPEKPASGGESANLDPDEAMHGGKGHSHDRKAVKEQPRDGPIQFDTVDPELAMHDEGGHVHEKKADSDTKTTHLPRESNDLDPDEMMHGGEHHTHDKSASAPAGQAADGARRGNSNLDPDDAMHGDSGHNHDGPAKERTASREDGKAYDKPNMEDALHGGEEDHVHERAKAPQKKPTRLAGMSDPDAVLAGHMDELIGEHGKHIAEENEKASANKLGKSGDDESFLGFSFPSLSNTIIEGIQRMKKRWLPKFFTSVEAPNTDIESEDEPVPRAEPHEHDSNQQQEGEEEESVDGTDMRHDLDSIGNTKPLKNHGKHTHKLKQNPDFKHDEG